MVALEEKLMREVAEAGLPPIAPGGPLVTDEDIAALPDAARRYMRFMGVVGRKRDDSFRMSFDGRFLFGGKWVACSVAQYNARSPVTRIFHMRLRVAGLVPTYVRDTYIDGKGHMLGKAFDLFRVVDDASEQIGIGECVTWVNDAVLMAPSMLLVPAVQWADAGPDAFDVGLTDAGRTVRARVYLDEAGAPVDFSTTDRFYVAPGASHPPVRAEWRTPVDGWQAAAARMFPTRARAVWMLDTGPLSYAELDFDPTRFAVDV